MRSGVEQYIRFQRIGNASFPLMSLLVGVLVAGPIELGYVLIAMTIIILLNGVVTFWNDIDDRQVDAANGRAIMQTIYGSGPYKKYVAAAIIQVLVCALSAVWLGLFAFVIVLLTIALSWTYNAGPVRASHRPIASIMLLSLIGAPLPMLLGMSLGLVSIQVALLLSLGSWIARLSISVLKDYKDATGDSKFGKKTFLLKYGARNVARLSFAACVFGVSVEITTLFVFSYINLAEVGLLSFASLVLVYLRQGLYRNAPSYDIYNSVFQRVSTAHLIFDLGIVFCLST